MEIAFLHNRRPVIALAAMAIVLIALADWSIVRNFSLGFLYILPIIAVAGVLDRWEIVVLSLACTILRELLSPFPLDTTVVARGASVLVGYTGAGLFVSELQRSRRLEQTHLGQLNREAERRREAEEQLRVLVETSPAGILTVDGNGKILLANRSAQRLLAAGNTLEGQPIGRYIPALSGVPALVHSPQPFRTMLEDRGRRENGEAFLAHVWFSTYSTASGPRLAAIVLDATEDLRDREEQGLRRLLNSSRILVSGVLHEVRNMCGATRMVFNTLARSPQFAANDDFQALGKLVVGLEKIAATHLQPSDEREPPEAELQAVFEDLRIIVEPGFADHDAAICWQVAEPLPAVRADAGSLLQVFLNLAQNSLRAMQNQPVRRLTIAASAGDNRVTVRVSDTGIGISSPDRLFRPFQEGSEASGLGLYVSRLLLRTFGAEIRYEPQHQGACFAVELLVADQGGPEANS